MAPLPPSADFWLRVALFGGAALVVGVPVGLMLWFRSPLHLGIGQVVEQPIEFDHRHHTRDDGIDCLYCHHDARRSPRAGVPSTELCMGCHAQVWNEGRETRPLRASWAADRPIRWRRVHDAPDFVFFDHRAHFEGGVGCESCHGRVDRMAHVYQTEASTMGGCLECHRDPVPHLRPEDALTRMGLSPSRARGERVADRLGGVSPPTHCTGCHR
ncbi:MAG TPA: cytochrome c3 family protein [Sandaracinaceae bacterium LLY-WYZ-13_1]|nr:cytochrome c3 family protein [Sandaracinaceae bacterium LLY-WYZ-13_1]